MPGWGQCWKGAPALHIHTHAHTNHMDGTKSHSPRFTVSVGWVGGGFQWAVGKCIGEGAGEGGGNYRSHHGAGGWAMDKLVENVLGWAGGILWDGLEDEVNTEDL